MCLTVFFFQFQNLENISETSIDAKKSKDFKESVIIGEGQENK